MPILPIPISLGDKTGDNADYRDQLPENLVIVPKQIKGDDAYLLTHPGLTEFATGQGVDRGAIYNSRQGAHYRVSGNNFIKVNSDGSTSIIGVTSGASQASLDYSFQTQGILSDGSFWLYDGVTLYAYSDPDLGVPIDFCWINGVYFFVDGENLYHTEAANEFAIEADTFATSEFSPDRTVGVLKNQQNQVVVFNRFSTEWFRDTGAATGFRFLRIEGKAVKIGIVGTHCKCELDGQVFVLGSRKEETPSIHAISGGTERTVASREIDQILESYTEAELSTAVLEARVERRNKYLIVTLPNHTLLYNHTVAQRGSIQRAWSILKSDLNSTPWRALNGIYDPDASKWIYGDRNDSSIGYLDTEMFSQYGEQQECVFYTPTIKLESFSIDSVEIETTPGRASEEMNAFLSMSYNGVTYGQETTMSVSTQSGYNLRMMLYRLGYIRDDFNFKFRMVASNPMTFTGLKIDYD